MQVYYEGYFENGRFIPFGLVNIPDRRKARVTVFDEIVSDEVGRRLSELDELSAMIDASVDEEVPLFFFFNLHREGHFQHIDGLKLVN
jgi:hypothetical protein